MFSITDRKETDAVSIFDFNWCPAAHEAINGSLSSGVDGVQLSFGPTTAVLHWPAWLRSVTEFGLAGGTARLILNPPFGIPQEEGHAFAIHMQGAHGRRALASFLKTLADEITVRITVASAFQRQAFEVCYGLASALCSERVGMPATQAVLPALFRPSCLPIAVDDMTMGPDRQHVRLTYQLPQIAGFFSQACSLRLFRNDILFGIEFRSLAGDHLPAIVRKACVEDDLGSLFRFTVSRLDGGAFLHGKPAEMASLQIIRAIARQVTADVTATSGDGPQTGFESGVWTHWLAAFPDLLATPALMPVDDV